MAGQSIGDRFVAAQHTIIGSDMSKSVCKASTSEVMGPKKKHLDYLNSLTSAPNINIPELADILIERSKQPKWVVVFKSLITTHHLMCYGNEKFLQHLASRNSLFGLSHFLDKSGVQGYDMSNQIRKYSLYLNEKAIAYRTVAYDFTRIPRGKGGLLRTLEGDKLLKALPVLQKLLDALLEFDATSNELINGVINAAFMLLFKDLIKLFACYNEGIINLLEKYFGMKKSQCKEALDAYKKFLTRMTKVSEMLKVAEQVGIDKGDIPDLTAAPSSLLNALEQHLASLEGKKTDSKQSVAADMNTFNAFNNSMQKIDENAKQSALDEEKNRLERFKKQREEELQKQGKSIISASSASPSVQQPTTSNASSDLLEIFGAPMPSANPTNNVSSSLAFPQTNPSTATSQQPFGFQQTQGFGTGMQPAQQFGINAAQPWGTSTQNTAGNMFGFDHVSAASTQPNLFANSPFNTTAADNGNALASSSLLQPTKSGYEQSPMQIQFPTQSQADNKDLESSLANAVANITVGGQKANRDFEPKTEKKLTGGMNYMPTVAPAPLTYNTSPMHTMAPVMVPVSQQRMPMYGTGMVGMNVMPMQMTQQPVYGVPYQQPYQQAPMRQLNPNNPFGSM